MKELVIISGKGGTGKTLISASFISLMKDAIGADCDVDTPNLHLLLKPSVISEEKYYGPKVALLNKSKCTLCGKCMEEDLCRFHAIGKGEFPVFNSFYCRGCGVCIVICPEKAIDLVEREAGKIYTGKTEKNFIVYGQLEPAQLGSGKMVVQIKNKARNMALEKGLELVIIDSSAGLGCTVIASLSNCNCALIVTEPTLSAISDLLRIIELTEYFNIPSFICINKCGINQVNEKKIIDFAREKEIKIIEKIPFYKDFAINNTGEIPVISCPESELSQKIINTWKKVLSLI